jgi:hypothetical protein
MRWIYVLLLSVPPAAAGWWGIYTIVGEFRPDDPGALTMFYILLFVASAATLLPLLAYLNQRFAHATNHRTIWTALRQSVWCGLCLTSWAWLLMQRALNVAFALIIAMIFVAIEVLIGRLKTRS